MKVLIPGLYKGDLAYILGISKVSDCILAAVVPRLSLLTRCPLPKSQKGTKSKAPPQRKCVPQAFFDPCRFQGLPVVDESAPSSIIESRDVQSFLAGNIKLQQIFDEWFTTRNVDDALETVVFNLYDDECIYRYRTRYYLHSLCILPVYGCGALEPVPVLSSLPMTLFIELKIDSLCINPTFSQSLWQEGDCLSDPHDIPHIICSINTVKRTVGVRPVYDIDDLGINVVPMREMQRRFCVRDKVIVSAGSNKGRYGLVVSEANDELTIFADTNQHVGFLHRQ